MLKNKLNNKKENKISFFGFFSFSAAIIITMLLFPTFASSGFNSIFFLIIGAFLWFLPIALCSSCLNSIPKWEHGGIFVWVKNSLGEKYGFAATFFQWFQSTIIYTILFYFLVSGINYLFDTNLFENNTYKFFLIIGLFSIATIIQLFGIKITAFISKISLFSGVLLPSVLLIILSFGYVFGSGLHTIPSTLNTNVIPTNNISNLVVFGSFILGYTGIEESASSSMYLKHAKRNYPIAIILVAILIVVINVLSSLSISFVLDQSQISLSSAIFNTFDLVIKNWFGNQFIWISKIIAFLVMFGIFGQINSIISGPSRGLSNSLKEINSWKFLQKTNKFNVNYIILIIQMIFMIIWLALITFLFQSNNTAFFACISITSLTYLIAYILMLASLIKISLFKKNYVETLFLNNKYLRLGISIVGMGMTLFTMIVVFFNPGNISNIDYKIYLIILMVSIVIIVFIPFIIYKLMKLKINKK